MSCEICGRKLKKDEEFILTGKYPSGIKILAYAFANWVPPEDYGRIFHKKCCERAIEKFERKHEVELLGKVKTTLEK
ncbi:MAG: hypothetical protein JSV51_01680 [Candidatus Bathyarchaeota archaeon]|nr:MAG: hypothetical protein JSV51_01680 [Candidatus Bathyarchaeota archaeon]